MSAVDGDLRAPFQEMSLPFRFPTSPSDGARGSPSTHGQARRTVLQRSVSAALSCFPLACPLRKLPRKMSAFPAPHAPVPVETEPASHLDIHGIGGHPRGLTTLFFAEMWERFSYYGMRALLILFMTASAAQGGLGMDDKSAAAVYGTYTMSVYLLTILGGYLADNFIGSRRAVLAGGIIIAMGHFTIALDSLATFYAGLVLVALGTGLLKPNISTMVGSLYHSTDERRDAGFSIFYMGINIGAFLAPLITGHLAQSDSAGRPSSSPGASTRGNSWHWGFAAAGVGMTLGLVVYVLARRQRLAHVGPGARACARPVAPLGHARSRGASASLALIAAMKASDERIRAIVYGLFATADRRHPLLRLPPRRRDSKRIAAILVLLLRRGDLLGASSSRPAPPSPSSPIA